MTGIKIYRRVKAAVLLSLLTIFGLLPLSSCHSLDDDRIPPYEVRISFYTIAEWNAYGLGGAMDWCSFIREKRIPASFPYTAQTFTGFGGVLLVMDVYGNPRAYDLACPVEAKSEVRVHVDPETMLAECEHCHSTYDVFSLYGHPVSGEAANLGYGLRRYYVGPGRMGEYMIVTN